MKLFEWIWKLCVSFLLIILGTSFIPEIKTESARTLFAFAILCMGIGIAHFSIKYVQEGLKTLKENKKNEH